MNCKKLKKILSAYLDGELNEHNRQEIFNHLKICSDCKKEYEILHGAWSRFCGIQNNYLKQFTSIEPSPVFRQNFWRKVRDAESNTVKNKIAAKIFRWWIPAPVFCSFGIVIFLIFSVVSPLLYGQNIRTSEKIVQLVKKMCLPSSQQKIFSPLNFTGFCEEYCQILCESYQQKSGSISECGRCKK